MRLRFDPVNDVGTTDCGEVLEVTLAGEPFRLYMDWDDPDAHRRVEFERTRAAQ